MTMVGWILMIVATGGMTFLMAWCIYKVISTKGSEKHLRAPLDIDTRD
jgi:hypothetical protein